VVQAERDKATLVANEVARETERLNRNSKEKALDQRTKEIMQNVAAADTARATAERLLDNSERSLQSARDTHAACVVSATAHAELLGDCQRDYREMAGKAQGHATDAKALIEAWPR
jgi:F0F1-type ATP synthase membrane subunit b/b'